MKDTLFAGIVSLIVVGGVGYGLFMDFFVYTDSKPTRHVRRTLKDAENGYPDAQYRMGTYRVAGRQGIEPDMDKARQWFEAAARQNHPGAQYRLGELYRRGESVEQNFEKALTLLMKAAEQGHPSAENGLGNMYHTGEGVNQSYDIALSWFKRAAEKDFPPAQRNMGIMAENGQGMEQDYEAAFHWYRKAVWATPRGMGKGLSPYRADPIAMHNLGLMYENGQFVEKDLERAYACYFKASVFRSYEPARQRKEAIETKLTVEQWRRAKESFCVEPLDSDL